ncbi:GNAT family N-acetyltransferase [Gilliamella sp. B14448G11]|uniref:GNAT family N-acetyltransferase n=1 Tax=unclassified Gilliamella TaxID=2685620 RepID=UPI0018DCD271|nr:MULTISPECIES: GNAT family N-acetyltransferase [unclassified Gilliamella]MBI0028463.1 GNAT family N-acetyltransferase [Gilliamella sp. B14448G7]MBI0031846.1 GNAT family N-acetyltransferase [Gilliamella sp. B14384G15]MBI0035706.1 GNAT family N-acetyltransferase [Gilliamella sp. B14448G11]MBI0042907.1 GNAT family N-acetyltransferase [Gilliamella sp. B14448G12]MBI0059215.1 GNAT family N-acetyltransferase [Gilliamella sp. B14384G12]
MIREFKSADLDKVMEIWLQGNEQAHNFIDSNFFKQNFDIVEMLIPMSTVYVQDLDGVKGFIGITENYISGLFVEQDYRRQGTGKALVNKAKQRYNELFAHVYKKNTDAINFFRSQNFEIISESINEESNESELLLRCNIEHNVKIGKCAL